MVKHIVLFWLSLISMLIHLRSNRAVLSCELLVSGDSAPVCTSLETSHCCSSQVNYSCSLNWNGLEWTSVKVDVDVSWAGPLAMKNSRESSHQPCKSVRRSRTHQCSQWIYCETKLDHHSHRDIQPQVPNTTILWHWVGALIRTRVVGHMWILGSTKSHPSLRHVEWWLWMNQMGGCLNFPTCVESSPSWWCDESQSLFFLSMLSVIFTHCGHVVVVVEFLTQECLGGISQQLESFPFSDDE